MRCLVLAFETLEDLPKNWEKFEAIDAYGQPKINDVPPQIKVYNEFFEIKENKEWKQYNFCFIKHPDPWGEPRNWMQAIAALGESLSGELLCEFWFPHEIKAFHFLLSSLVKAEFLDVKQLNDTNGLKNYQARWNITKGKDMYERYQENKTKILKKFYKEMDMDDISIEEL